MSTVIKKFAPQLIVLAVVLYWSWPALKASLPQAVIVAAKTEPAKPAGEKDFAGVLSPKFPPPANRNPFTWLDAKSPAAAKSAKRKQKDNNVKAAADIRDSSLVLNATCLVGRQRMAIINGRIYKEKEAIQRSGDEAASCILSEILPHKVLLLCEGQTVQLSYLNAATKPAAKPAAGGNPRKPTK